MTWAPGGTGFIAHDYHDAHFNTMGDRVAPTEPGAIHRLESECHKDYRDPGPLASARGLKKCGPCRAEKDEQNATLDDDAEESDA